MTYIEPNVDEVRSAVSGLRPRYAQMRDPHDRPGTSAGQPAIQLVNYMSDADSYYEINLIGPYPDEAARDRELVRLRGLPLGAPEYNGGYEFRAATITLGEASTVVAPPQVAQADTVQRFFAAFYGYDLEGDRADAAHPDQMTLGFAV